MNIEFGGHVFQNVDIPVLWGDRAIFQDKEGLVSVIDVSQPTPTPEIIANEPAPGVDYLPTTEGLRILSGGSVLYMFQTEPARLHGVNLDLPDIVIDKSRITVGTNVFESNFISGAQVGLAITSSGMGMGAPLPENLRRHLRP
jgi:hypothetical protein